MPFIRRVALKNYKNIRSCDVALQDLTLLVGPNGSGKSNFLDALDFTKQAVDSTLDVALRERGGIDSVRRRSVGHPHDFTIRVDLNLPDGASAAFAFTVGARKGSRFVIRREKCSVDMGVLEEKLEYEVKNGELVGANFSLPPDVPTDRLYLARVGALEGFREVFDGLVRMGFYNLNPQEMRAMQSPDYSDILTSSGSNIASVVGELSKPALTRVNDFLARISPGTSAVRRVPLGQMESLEFAQQVEGSPADWKFRAWELSDGTLRAVGTLIALFQSSSVPLVAIEEPETALHPAAAGVLADALRESSQTRQVLATTHSPEMLDSEAFGSDSILAVDVHEGIASIGSIDDRSKEALRSSLYTPGELLRERRLQPKSPPATELRTESLFVDGTE
ncbi:MAG: AAA family ATPase [Solirubrobacterales bacterium]